MRKKVVYVRNYGERVDLTWQDVFQTTGSQSEREDLNATGSYRWLAVFNANHVAHEQVEVLTALARLRLLLAHRAVRRGRNKF
jgi:hypothetical protein